MDSKAGSGPDVMLGEAWSKYDASLVKVREAFLSSDILKLAPEEEAGIYRCLAQAQAHAHNMIVSPDPDRPVFYLNPCSIPSPILGSRHAPTSFTAWPS